MRDYGNLPGRAQPQRSRKPAAYPSHDALQTGQETRNPMPEGRGNLAIEPARSHGMANQQLVTCAWCGSQFPEEYVDRKDHDSVIWLCMGCLYCSKHGSPRLDDE